MPIMNHKLVSIITPTYNCGDFIAQTIESVLSQTYTNWELIIVDDNSSDNTQYMVDKYIKQDHRIQYHKLNQNQGVANARNFALNLSKGTYIAFLDSDDLWGNNKLEEQIEFMEKNKYFFSCTSYIQIDENGNSNGKVIKSVDKASYNRVLLDCPIGNSSVIYNAEKIGKIETPNIKKRNDDALWLKILKREKYIYGLEKPLMSYRIRKNSISRNKFDLIKYHWILYRKIENLSIVRSVFHILVWVIIKLLRIK